MKPSTALITALTAVLLVACNVEDETIESEEPVETDDASVEAFTETDAAEAPPVTTCPETPCATDEICDSWTKRCRAGLPEGEVCAPGLFSDECRVGLVCSALTETCSLPAGEGEACASLLECETPGIGGLTCDLGAGRCVGWGTLPEGAACTPWQGLGGPDDDSECAADLFCGPAPTEGGPPAPGDDALTVGFRCRTLGAQGETCLLDVGDTGPTCQPGLVCTSRDGGVHVSCEPRNQ